MKKKYSKIAAIIIIVLAFGIFEACMLVNAAHQKQHAKLVASVEELESELIALESAINTGNQSLYDDNYQKFSASTSELANYSETQHLAELAKTYSNTLAEQKESISTNLALQEAYQTYGGDIAERLCTPSELKKTRHGERRPNSREEWLDTQARALHQAARRVSSLYSRMTKEV